MHSFEAHEGLRVRVVQPDHSTIPVPYEGQYGTITAELWDEEPWAKVRLDSGEVTTYRLSELEEV